jgi:uncharacterized lipoprotein YajG
MLSDRRRQLRAAAAIVMLVAFASPIAGCAARVPERPITYIPQTNVQLLKDADTVPVEVKVEDAQPSESISRLALFVNRQNELRFRVKDAADTLKTATETELKARGFNLGAGGALITIQMVHFEANYQSEDLVFVTTVRGTLFMRVQVRAQTGKVVFSKDVEDQAAPVSGFFMLHPATHELQESLEEGFRGLFHDPAFTAAILATRQSPAPPAKPRVSPGRIAGAFAIMSRR